jgi:hypothetical protein
LGGREGREETNGAEGRKEVRGDREEGREAEGGERERKKRRTHISNDLPILILPHALNQKVRARLVVVAIEHLAHLKERHLKVVLDLSGDLGCRTGDGGGVDPDGGGEGEEEGGETHGLWFVVWVMGGGEKKKREEERKKKKRREAIPSGSVPYDVGRGALHTVRRQPSCSWLVTLVGRTA